MLKHLLIVGGISLILSSTACRQTTTSDHQAVKGTYPAAEGFNAADSDSLAIAVADSVMQAMGGYQSWENTKILQWNFFGNRTHTWNKHSGRDSISIPAQNLVIDMNVQSKEGDVWRGGEQITNADSLQKYLQQGYQMWVNDSYWLLMPYKLKDSGLTLAYAAKDTTQTGQMAHKLKMTFDSVGVTPDNMYHVWVDTTDHMVRQWAYYPNAETKEPRFILPWNDYKKYGKIMLSGNRGGYTISDIKVLQEWPKR